MEATGCFVRYRCRPLGPVKLSTKEAHRTPPCALRQVEHKSFPDLAPIVELCDHLPVNPNAEQADGKVRFTDVDIPRSLVNLAPSSGGLTGLLLPDQLQVKWVAKEPAKGLANIPPYAPYLAPELSFAPWLPDMAERRSSIANWGARSNRANRKRLPQVPPLPSMGALPTPLHYCGGVMRRIPPFRRNQ